MKKNYQAIDEYTSSLKFMKNNEQFHVYINRGLCYREIGKLESSIDDMTKACEISKDNPIAHFQLGVNFLLNFNYDCALEKFNTAIEMDQLEPKFQNYKALALYMN